MPPSVSPDNAKIYLWKDKPLMHPEIQFVSKYQSLTIQLRGKVSFHRIALYLKRLLNDPQWDSGMKVLIDCRNICIRHLATRVIYDIAEIFKINKNRIGQGQWAFVMRNKVDYGLARMWQLLTEDYVDFNSQICMSLEEAWEWLDLPREVFPEFNID